MEKEYKTGTFIMGRCTVIVTRNEGNYQMIVSCKDSKPSHNEVVNARYKYLPDNITMVQIFPPYEEYKQFDPNSHFLFQIIK